MYDFPRLHYGALLFLGLGLFIFIQGIEAKDPLRHEDVIYVDDYLKKPIELKVLQSALITSSREGSGALTTLSSGQKVHLLGITPERYLIEVRTFNSRMEGWFLPSNLEPISEETFKELETKRNEAEKLDQSIKKGEVEIGMSSEVIEKIFGKTKEKSIVKDASGTLEVWKYATYKMMPFQTCTVVNGVNMFSTTYKKVAVGSKLVTFKDKKVIRFEIKQEEAPTSPQSQIIVRPGYIQ